MNSKLNLSRSQLRTLAKIDEKEKSEIEGLTVSEEEVYEARLAVKAALQETAIEANSSGFAASRSDLNGLLPKQDKSRHGLVPPILIWRTSYPMPTQHSLRRNQRLLFRDDIELLESSRVYVGYGIHRYPNPDGNDRIKVRVYLQSSSALTKGENTPRIAVSVTKNQDLPDLSSFQELKSTEDTSVFEFEEEDDMALILHIDHDLDE